MHDRELTHCDHALTLHDRDQADLAVNYQLAHLSDDVLLRDLVALVAHDRCTNAAMLAHIAEVDARRLYVPAGHSSMFAYCVEDLRLSEDAAYKRIRAARAARQFPALFIAVAEGRLHLAAVSLIAPHLTAETVDDLIEAATHRRKSEIEEWLARTFPSWDVSAKAHAVPTIRPIPQLAPERVANGSMDQLALGRVAEDSSESQLVLGRVAAEPSEGPLDIGRVAEDSSESQLVLGRVAEDSSGDPLALGRVASGSNEDQMAREQPAGEAGEQPGEQPGHRLEEAARPQLEPTSGKAAARYLVQLTITQSTHDKLRHAQALLSHVVPAGEVAQVLDRALDALIAQLEKRKVGVVSRRPPRDRSTSTREVRCPTTGSGSAHGRRYIPAQVRRAVWERDEGQCTFVSAAGHRCTARRFLEFDHVEPVARGGKATVEGMRLRCRAHNQFEAERAFGADFMDRKRRDARRAAEVSKRSRDNSHAP